MDQAVLVCFHQREDGNIRLERLIKCEEFRKRGVRVILACSQTVKNVKINSVRENEAGSRVFDRVRAEHVLRL